VLKPRLLERQKAERRARILAVARKLITRRGVAGLTMRDLAAESGVSVPTIYNLVGGKSALLFALLQEMVVRIAAGLSRASDGSFLDQAFVLVEAARRELLASPRYSQQLVHFFLSTDEESAVRRTFDEQHVAVMAEVIRQGQRQGQVVDWIDPCAASGAMYSLWTATLIRWAKGEIDEAGMDACLRSGLGLVLLGIARGASRDRVEALIREHQHAALPQTTGAQAPAKGA